MAESDFSVWKLSLVAILMAKNIYSYLIWGSWVCTYRFLTESNLLMMYVKPWNFCKFIYLMYINDNGHLSLW